MESQRVLIAGSAYLPPHAVYADREVRRIVDLDPLVGLVEV